MILKNLTRTKAGTGQLVRYIFRYLLKGEKTGAVKQQNCQPFIIRHNIRSKTVEGFVKEFENNLKRRKYKRKDQTIIHHTILSWSHRDAEQITDPKLRAIARRFIELRGENNLYVGTKHTDRSHIHLHIAVSGNQVNGTSSRMSRKEFETLKKQLTAFQQEHFPELVHSIPRHGLKKIEWRKSMERQREKSTPYTKQETVLNELAAIRAKKEAAKELDTGRERERKKVASPFIEPVSGLFGDSELIAQAGISPG